MNKEELIGKLQMVYVGDRNALNEMIGYYDGLKQVIEILKQENQKYKEVIDKAIDILSKMMYAGYLKELNESTIQYMATGEKGEFGTRVKIILDILKEVE